MSEKKNTKENRRLDNVIGMLWGLYRDELGEKVTTDSFSKSIANVIKADRLYIDKDNPAKLQIASKQNKNHPFVKGLCPFNKLAAIELMTNLMSFGEDFNSIYALLEDTVQRLLCVGYVIGKHEPDILSSDNANEIAQNADASFRRMLNNAALYQVSTNPGDDLWRNILGDLDKFTGLFSPYLLNKQMSLSEAREILNAFCMDDRSRKIKWEDCIDVIDGALKELVKP